MGIKNFHPVIKRNAPRAYSEYTFEELAGKWVGIDVSIFIYRYMCVDGEGWMNGIAYLFEALRSNGIKFVTIFDGKAPPEKEAEHLKRRGAQDKLKQKAVDLLWLVEHLDELGMDSRVCDTTEEFERTTRLGM